MAHKCRECGSERIAPSVRVAPSGAGGLLAQLRARVCADCGYTELFMDEAMNVFLAHQEVAAPASAASGSAANLQCPRCGSVIPAASTSCEACGWSAPAARA